MALKGSATFTRSKRAHQRLASKYDYDNIHPHNFALFMYHTSVSVKMDEKKRTLTKDEKKKCYQYGLEREKLNSDYNNDKISYSDYQKNVRVLNKKYLG